jgi:hypothetical protein
MPSVRSILLVTLVACSGRSQPATTTKPTVATFDAKALAAEINSLVSEMADAATAPNVECAAVVTKLAELEQHGRPVVERVRDAQLDPERAKELTRELHVYDRFAAGRSEAIARRLAICFQEHGELQDQIQQVVDAMPKLDVASPP